MGSEEPRARLSNCLEVSRAKLHAVANADRVSLTVLAQLANTSRTRIRRLERHLQVAPQMSSVEAGKRARLYSMEEGENLLLAASIVEDLQATPRAAAKQVLEMRREQGQFTGSHVLDTLVEIALSRFQGHVIARMLGTVACVVFQRETLDPGTVIELSRRASSSQQHGSEPARSTHPAPVPLITGVVTDTHEINFHRALSLASAGWKEEPIVIPGRAGYVLALRTAGANSITVAGAMSSADLDLVMLLLDAMTEGFERLQAEVRRKVPPRLTEFKGPASTLFDQDLLLWIAARFACEVAYPEKPADALGIVSAMDSNGTGPQLLVELASTSLLPWNRPDKDREKSRNSLRPGQLLSAYASIIHAPVTVEQTIPPYDAWVTQYQHERDRSNPSQLSSCIAVPTSTRGEQPSPVLYVSMPFVQPRFDSRVRGLQVLAPVIGELIERRFNARQAIEVSTRSARSIYLTYEALQRAMTTHIAQLVDKVTPGRHVSSSARLACVVLKPAAGAAPFGPVASAWLAKELKHLVPDAFLPDWVTSVDHVTEFMPPILGTLPDDIAATLIFIPRWLDKAELDRLRASMAGRFHANGRGSTERGEDTVQLNAWIVDVKLGLKELPDDEEQAKAARSAEVDRLKDSLLENAADAARVLEQIVSGYTAATLRGDWEGALLSVQAGLDIKPSNPYLLRRAAEYSTCAGDFTNAELYARQATHEDPSSVMAHCWLGDALLGQGKVSQAIAEYEMAWGLDANNPHPHYSRGFALLTVARLLRQEIANAAVKAVASATDQRGCNSVAQDIQTVESTLKLISDEAARSFRLALPQLRRWGTPGLFEFQNFESVPAAFGLIQTEELRGNTAGAISRVRSALKDHPRENVLYREMIFASMWHSGLASKLYRDVVEKQAEAIFSDNGPPEIAEH